ncbi:MAG: EAL domain-containing protein [Gammaproteobacteria bacterium]|nr:EAL domain-containing protein [Gammaproteobacteria bacterium]
MHSKDKHSDTHCIPSHPALGRLGAILADTADIILVTDTQAIIEYVNPACEYISGHPPAEALGKNLVEFLKSSYDKEFFVNMQTCLLEGKVYHNKISSTSRDGALYQADITVIPLIDQRNEVSHFVAMIKNVAEHIQDELEIQYAVNHDVLTNLPNRTLFLDRLEQAISKAHYHQRLVAVIYIDIDLFRNVNDSLGQQIGDNLLKQLAQRFTTSIREGDTISRIGGDVFAILLDDFDSDNSLSAIAQKVLSSLSVPFNINDHEIHITASIGISIYPNDSDDAETLLHNADIALYRAKESGKNNFQFFSESMTARVFERISLENSLRHALERNEFRLYYQPQFDARTGQIFGVEALLRWQHPELGTITPAHFIPLLEETGLIEPVGIWIFETACQQSRQWHAAGLEHLHMSVNLSSRQFNNASFISSLQTIIKDTEVNPEFLELELTESMLMRNASSTINALKGLTDLGVRFAIDDFGTGYSSLNYLRRFPIDTIKIDRSFIRDITTDSDDRAICSAIIGMAQSLSLNVIAEGVETDEQLNLLKARDCHYIQGNIFSQALTAEKITQLLHTQH